MSITVDKASCVECCFRFYAVVSRKSQKTMKNPLFRAYYEETAGIEQDRRMRKCGSIIFSLSKNILVSTLMC